MALSLLRAASRRSTCEGQQCPSFSVFLRGQNWTAPGVVTPDPAATMSESPNPLTLTPEEKAELEAHPIGSIATLSPQSASSSGARPRAGCSPP